VKAIKDTALPEDVNVVSGPAWLGADGPPIGRWTSSGLWEAPSTPMGWREAP